MTQRKQWSWITGIGLSAALALTGCGSDTKDTSTDVGDTSATMLAPSLFESNDGNLVVDGGGTGAEDWANAPNLKIKIDKPSGTSDDAFTGGAKEDSQNPSVSSGSIPPNKSDLTRFYVANEKLSNNHYYLYLAWERTNVLGSANMDFELNQSKSLVSNGVTPVRTDGDILITFDFTNGGGNPVLGMLRWVTTGAPSQCFANNALPCWGNRVNLSDAGFADGAVNTVSVSDPIRAQPGDPPRTLVALTFGEAAVDLTAAGVFPVNPTTCTSFSSAYLKSRSSASFTAELKDFIAPVADTISNCGDIIIHKTITGGAALQGAGFTAYKDGTINATDPTKCDFTAGAQTYTCSTDATGTCDMSGVLGGSYCVAETTTPTGYFTANAQVVTVAPLGSVDVYFEDAPKRTVKVQKVDDAGNNVSGATFTLCSGTVTTVCTATTANTCTTGSNGSCTIANLAFGTYTLFETSVPTGYKAGIPSTGQGVTIASGDADPKVVNVMNPRLFRIITIVCRETDSTLWPSTVSLTGFTDKTSVTAANATAAGVTEAQLCGLASGMFTGLLQANSPFAPSISIPLSLP